MRVVSVVRPAEVLGGLETIVARVGEGLRAAGDHQMVLVFGRGASTSATADYFRARTETATAESLRDAAVLLRGADVVHVHAPTMTYWSMPLMAMARLRRLRVFLTIHLPSEPGRRPRRRGRVAASAEQYVRGLLVQLLRVPCFADGTTAGLTASRRWRNRVPVRGLLNGIPDRGWSPPEPAEHLRVALVGRLAEHKNPLLFLDAVALARAQGADVRAHLVGSGPLAEAVRDRVHREDLGPDVVHLHGQMADPSPVVEECDLLALVSRAEGNPVVVMEAASLGRPALVRTGLEGLDESLPGTYIGVPPDSDARGFANALVRLSRSKADLIEMGAAARRHYETTFSLDAAAQRYQRIYRGEGPLEPPAMAGDPSTGDARPPADT